MKQTTFFSRPGFSEICDIPDLHPAGVFPNPLLVQQVGYASATPDAGTEAGAAGRNGLLYSERLLANTSGYNGINQFVVPNCLQSVCLSVNGEQDRTDTCGWMTDTAGETHPAVFRHFGTDLLIGLDGSPGQRSGGRQGQATALTDRNGNILKVAGWSSDANGEPHPVLWILDYSTNPVSQQISPLTAAAGKALKIHNNGTIVGWYSENGVPNAFSWKPDNTFTKVGTLTGGGFSIATGISNRGTVIGYGSNAAGIVKPFISERGGLPFELPSWPGPAQAYDINDYEVIVGRAHRSVASPSGIFNEYVAVAWDEGMMYDLNEEAGDDEDYQLSKISLTKASAINNSNHIAGTGISNGRNNGWEFLYKIKPNDLYKRFRHLFQIYWEFGPPPPFLYNSHNRQLMLQLLISEEAGNLGNVKLEKTIRVNALKAARDIISVSIKE